MRTRMWLFGGLRWVGVVDGGVLLWPLPFVPGCPHPGPLPPSGRGDLSIMDGCCSWWVWECRGVVVFIFGLVGVGGFPPRRAYPAVFVGVLGSRAPFSTVDWCFGLRERGCCGPSLLPPVALTLALSRCCWVFWGRGDTSVVE